MGGAMFDTRRFGRFAVLVVGGLFGGSAGLALAADVAPAFDPNVCKIEYPRVALMREEQGTIVVSVSVTADGKVTDVKVDKSSGHKSLDKAAIAALTTCKFKPGTKDGKVGDGVAKVEYTWKLD